MTACDGLQALPLQDDTEDTDVVLEIAFAIYSFGHFIKQYDSDSGCRLALFCKNTFVADASLIIFRSKACMHSNLYA
eukprot:m.1185565 g.1185565  ORF g.1185565 m.1185565 type:complete len:77 (-) comp24544_c1_seq47:571-801(-)